MGVAVNYLCLAHYHFWTYLIISLSYMMHVQILVGRVPDTLGQRRSLKGDNEVHFGPEWTVNTSS